MLEKYTFFIKIHHYLSSFFSLLYYILLNLDTYCNIYDENNASICTCCRSPALQGRFPVDAAR